MSSRPDFLEAIAEGAVRGALDYGKDVSEFVQERNKAYRDRNLLAVAFIAEYAAAEGKERVGWYDHGGDEWAVIYADMNAGQVSWHVPKAVVPDWIPQRHQEVYDGHSRSEKNAVLVETYLGEEAVSDE